MKIRIAGRLAFPALFEAKTVNGEGEPAFSAAVLFASSDPEVLILNEDKTKTKAKLSDCLKKVAESKWGPKGAATYAALVKADKVCIHDGDSKAEFEGYEGNHFISARNKVRPLVLDADGSPLTAADGKPYGGCYVNLSLELWAQDNKFGKRINASLRGCQYVKEGDAFAGGGVADESDFDIEAGTDADDLS